ncbi:hypothetical protein GUITHDRAFT_117863 [Guillardia theta CCMP2712]|uniref:Uncharacterized protein n=2 Tax=Guillardia theta TaxID=55529 RepID=L1II68_GUITC|nr:hypothetical protein GUITHDRAFT_117863 [Guillardia theta CCMP2712]EKX35948.1 hypothetical protein GUITHDRAFT_117863 [Guillardia theta CCMP2712]|eukprot:XP_005822928.1 hypothetical protein GUITHDRAFT_117863 [Guillardia theta CCMP2712]
MTLVILYMVTALTMMWRRMGQHKAGRRRETRQLAANTSQAMLLHAVAREAKLKQVKLSAARARSLDPIGSTGQHGVSAYRNRSAEAEAMLEAAKDQGLDRFLQQKACGATGLHVFYYAWYANRDNDDHWSHWNHKVLPHWTAAVNERFKDRIGQEHAPPLDIGSNFFPSLGAYSSKDPAVVELHVEMMAKSGMGVLVYSWWGRGKADANGDPTDERLIELVMNKCEERRVKFAFHLEPYEGRTARSVGEDVAYILRRFGSHPALYRNPSR